MRLIDAEELQNRLDGELMYIGVLGNEEYLNGKKEGYVYALMAIDEQPTIDAVQVVRCKECKWFRTPDKKHNHSYCYRLADHSVYISGDTHEDEFCAWAERKEKDGEGLDR